MDFLEIYGIKVRVIPGVTWTHLIYIYIYICVCVTIQIQVLKLQKWQKRYIIKEQVIETIKKIYNYSKEKYKKKKKVHEPIKQ